MRESVFSNTNRQRRTNRENPNTLLSVSSRTVPSWRIRMQQLFRLGFNLGFGLLQLRLSQSLVWRPLLRPARLFSRISPARPSPTECEAARRKAALHPADAETDSAGNAEVTKRLRDRDPPTVGPPFCMPATGSNLDSCMPMRESRFDPNGTKISTLTKGICLLWCFSIKAGWKSQPRNCTSAQRRDIDSMKKRCSNVAVPTFPDARCRWLRILPQRR